MCLKLTAGREKKVDLAPLLRAGLLHELSRFVCSLASNPVSQYMYVELTMALGASVLCSLVTYVWRRCKEGGIWENVKVL